MTTNRKPPYGLLIFAAFALAVATVPLMCRWRGRRHEPLTVAALVSRAESDLHLYPVAASQTGKVAGGVYLCRQEGRKRTDLPQGRQRVFLADWKGVVLATPVPTTDSRFAQSLDEWGDAAAVVGNVLVWGDPELIAELVSVLTKETTP